MQFCSSALAFGGLHGLQLFSYSESGDGGELVWSHLLKARCMVIRVPVRIVSHPLPEGCLLPPLICGKKDDTRFKRGISDHHYVGGP